MTDSNTRNLEPIFTEPTATLNAMQKDWWNGWLAGRDIDQNVYNSLPLYKRAADLFVAYTGKSGVSKSREAYLAKLRADQAFYKAYAAEHVGRYRATQQTVDDAVLLVIDAEGDTAPRAALLDAGVPADEVARIAGKNGSRRKVKKSLQRHAQHPNAQRMIQTTGKREYMRMGADTLSGSLEGIAVNMKTHALLAELKANAVEQAAQIAELQAWKAAVEIRHAVEDSGVDVKAEAVRMRADGMSLGAIAQTLGTNKSAIQRWTA